MKDIKLSKEQLFEMRKKALVGHLKKEQVKREDAKISEDVDPRVYHIDVQSLLFLLNSEESEKYVMGQIRKALHSAEFGQVCYVFLDPCEIEPLKDVLDVVSEDSKDARIMITCVCDSKKRKVMYQFISSRAPKFIKTGGKFDKMVESHYCSVIAGHLFDSTTTTEEQAIGEVLQYLTGKMKEAELRAKNKKTKLGRARSRKGRRNKY